MFGILVSAFNTAMAFIFKSVIAKLLFLNLYLIFLQNCLIFRNYLELFQRFLQMFGIFWI